MITNLDPQSEVFLADLDRLQRRLAEASHQISSGKRVATASDAPDAISGLLRLRGAIEKNVQIQTNLGVANSDANTAEGALNTATQLLDRALTLAAQGATATQSGANRLNIAAEVESIQNQMVSLSQTQSGGRYVFSGDAETSPAYQINLANGNGVDRLVTAASTRLMEDPSGSSFTVAQTAQQIFDARNPDDTLTSDNVFAALNGLRLALVNNDTAGIQTAITSVKQASDRLNTSLAFYGTVQHRIAAAVHFASKYAVQLRTELSEKQDADVVAASLELSEDTAHIQAALQTKARIPRTTLFDFLS